MSGKLPMTENTGHIFCQIYLSSRLYILWEYHTSMLAIYNENCIVTFYKHCTSFPSCLKEIIVNDFVHVCECDPWIQILLSDIELIVQRKLYIGKMLKLLLVPKLLNIKYKLYGYSDDLIETITLGHLFSRATNFADFVDFWDFHKICFTEN